MDSFPGIKIEEDVRRHNTTLLIPPLEDIPT
jgi:hypothetical protein